MQSNKKCRWRNLTKCIMWSQLIVRSAVITSVVAVLLCGQERGENCSESHCHDMESMYLIF